MVLGNCELFHQWQQFLPRAVFLVLQLLKGMTYQNSDNWLDGGDEVEWFSGSSGVETTR